MGQSDRVSAPGSCRAEGTGSSRVLPHKFVFPLTVRARSLVLGIISPLRAIL